ncbi:UPF0658 Golgi apparatus membrane protein [Vanrija pseudolonga]|uniref:UPF0658 Golgi apparatus membrane protein n=1 Tax=Vanrija pseudolonga TaxID=143232 RepID=A0AAF0YEY3_9TREE|nr:UPF0658 Golgi apparatus membrane protein [Vanrija pseudolonga]
MAHSPSSPGEPDHRFTISDYIDYGDGTTSPISPQRGGVTSPMARVGPSAAGPSRAPTQPSRAPSNQGYSGHIRPLPRVPPLTAPQQLQHDPPLAAGQALGPGPEPLPVRPVQTAAASASPDEPHAAGRSGPPSEENYVPRTQPTYPPRSQPSFSDSRPGELRLNRPPPERAPSSARPPKSHAFTPLRDEPGPLPSASSAAPPSSFGGVSPSASSTHIARSPSGSTTFTPLVHKAKRQPSGSQNFHPLVQPQSPSATSVLSPGLSPLPPGAGSMAGSPYRESPSVLADDDDEKPHESEKKVDFPPAAGANAPPKRKRWAISVWLDRIIPDSTPCRLLVLVVFLEAIINIAIQANIFWRYNREMDCNSGDKQCERLPVYITVFGIAHVVQVGLTVYAIRTRNTIQVIALAIFGALLLIYAVIEMAEVRKLLGATTTSTDSSEHRALLTLPLNALTSVVIALIALAEFTIIVLTYLIWREFGWRIYRFLGADLRIRRYYREYQIFECLVCFSFFFFAGFGIQFIFLVLNKTDPEYILTWVMLPLSLVWLVMGVIAARMEISWLMATFDVGLVGGLAYFIFKLVRVFTDKAQVTDSETGKPVSKYYRLTWSLSVFTALSIVMIILCLVFGIIVWRNFGKGLKQAGE